MCASRGSGLAEGASARDRDAGKIEKRSRGCDKIFCFFPVQPLEEIHMIIERSFSREKKTRNKIKDYIIIYNPSTLIIHLHGATK